MRYGRPEWGVGALLRRGGLLMRRGTFIRCGGY